MAATVGKAALKREATRLQANARWDRSTSSPFPSPPAAPPEQAPGPGDWFVRLGANGESRGDDQFAAVPRAPDHHSLRARRKIPAALAAAPEALRRRLRVLAPRA